MFLFSQIKSIRKIRKGAIPHEFSYYTVVPILPSKMIHFLTNYRHLLSNVQSSRKSLHPYVNSFNIVGLATILARFLFEI